jgi:hypothetical protein
MFQMQGMTMVPLGIYEAHEADWGGPEIADTYNIPLVLIVGVRIMRESTGSCRRPSEEQIIRDLSKGKKELESNRKISLTREKQ